MDGFEPSTWSMCIWGKMPQMHSNKAIIVFKTFACYSYSIVVKFADDNLVWMEFSNFLNDWNIVDWKEWKKNSKTPDQNIFFWLSRCNWKWIERSRPLLAHKCVQKYSWWLFWYIYVPIYLGRSPAENWWVLILDTDRNPEGTTWEWCVCDRLLPLVDEYSLQQTMSAVRVIRSALSSRLTAGYLHMCAVKEQRAWRGVAGQMYGVEITLHCCPAFTLTASKRFYPFLICPELRRQEAPTWQGECETYYLIAPQTSSQMRTKVPPLRFRFLKMRLNLISVMFLAQRVSVFVQPGRWGDDCVSKKKEKKKNLIDGGKN